MRRAIVIASLALAACAGVLGLRTDTKAAFPHRAHVTHGIACTTCHGGVQKAGDDRAMHLPTTDTCTQSGCHAKPHDARTCLDCHADPDAIAAATEARDHLTFSHERHLPRAEGNCMRCHVGVAEGDDHLRPAMQQCFRCHAHEAAQDARACDACHRDLTENDPPASHLSHDGDWLHAHGARAASSGDVCMSCHQTAFCSECHGTNAPVIPARLHFDDPMRASVHRAGFQSRHGLEARAEPGSCSTCHSPSSCESCHAREGVTPPTTNKLGPHPPGWVGLTPESDQHGRAARADPTACAACHGGAGEQLCVRCHQVGGIGGNPHPPGWQSRQPMSALPCRLCHRAGLP